MKVVGVSVIFCLAFIAILLRCSEAENKESDSCNNDSCASKLLNIEGCGMRPNVNDRSLRGKETQANSWPWMVSLKDNGEHFCGGSLISKDFVLTAAHCFWSFTTKQMLSGEAKITFVIGDHKLDTKEPTEQTFTIAGVILGKQFSDGSRIPEYNDIALFKLNASVVIDKQVVPVCLPEAVDDVKTGETLKGIGWGITERFTVDLNTSKITFPDFSNVLREFDAKVIDNENCMNVFSPSRTKNTELLGEYEAGPDMLCTKEVDEIQHHLTGDSGGPLMKHDAGSNKWIQVGITSYTMPRGGESVFAKVSHFRKWIENGMKTLNLMKAEIY